MRFLNQVNTDWQHKSSVIVELGVQETGSLFHETQRIFMATPSMQAVREQALAVSQLPASMNGDPVLYATTLTSLMCGFVLGLYVVCWMVKDLHRDRKVSSYKTVLFNFRLMMGLAGFAAMMACTPEVLYLQMYNDPQVSKEAQSAVLTGKRIVDTLRIYVILGWVGLLGMIYPYVCLALIDCEKTTVSYLQVADYPGLGRLAKPIIVFMTVAAIAMAFAFSKVYAL
jgi:hypothetical protein